MAESHELSERIGFPLEISLMGLDLGTWAKVVVLKGSAGKNTCILVEDTNHVEVTEDAEGHQARVHLLHCRC